MYNTNARFPRSSLSIETIRKVLFLLEVYFISMISVMSDQCIVTDKKILGVSSIAGHKLFFLRYNLDAIFNLESVSTSSDDFRL